MKPLFFANWKMNKTLGEARAFCDAFTAGFVPASDGIADVGIAPPLTALAVVAEALRASRGIVVGAQNVHWLDSGAHTGEVSPAMIKELGASFAIIGHSERRQFYGEADKAVSLRAHAALSHGLTAIVCVGELREQFEGGETERVVDRQIRASLDGISRELSSRLIIAYEPVWAIGTGLAATPEIASRVHGQVRRLLQELLGEVAANRIPILYGGSTTPENVAELVTQPNVNGALVGGASLKADVFNALVSNGRAAAA